MIYRPLGNTGLSVSEIGLGCEGFLKKSKTPPRGGVMSFPFDARRSGISRIIMASELMFVIMISPPVSDGFEKAGQSELQPGRNACSRKLPQQGEKPGTREGRKGHGQEMRQAVFCEHAQICEPGKAPDQDQEQRVQHVDEQRKFLRKPFHRIRPPCLQKTFYSSVSTEQSA